MIGSTAMTVNLRVPARTIHQGAAERLTAKAENGLFGVLPNHIDFVAALVPGVLTLVEPGGRERFFGVDEGVFVKQGSNIDICVRRAVEGEDLAKLTATVLKAFVECPLSGYNPPASSRSASACVGMSFLPGIGSPLGEANSGEETHGLSYWKPYQILPPISRGLGDEISVQGSARRNA